MSFIAPMLAHPMPDVFEFKHHEWIAEQKFDGHRMVIEVSRRRSSLLDDFTITAWSRHGKTRELPGHLRDALSFLPDGIYDGELMVQGARSFGVTELGNASQLEFVAFDILESNGVSTTDLNYFERRGLLELSVEHVNAAYSFGTGWNPVSVALPIPITSLEEAENICRQMWSKGEEGLILKRTDAVYQAGKRSKGWIKMKQLQSAELTCIGFRKGRLGPNSVIVLLNDQGMETTVKVRNASEMAAIDNDPRSYVGRLLRIEFQERTPDGSYRHGRMDHWVNEVEEVQP